ncbi:ComF family protein [Desulfosoma sp.]
MPFAFKPPRHEGLRKIISGVLSRAADVLFPPRCAACGGPPYDGPDATWCRACFEHLPFVVSPLCPRCGRPYASSEAMPDHLCGECLSDHFRFDAARSAVIYEGPVRRGILQLKFGGKLHWAPALGRLAALHPPTRNLLDRSEVILPVPMHLRRVRRRGYNQAALLARFAGRMCSRPVAVDAVVRTRFTRPQTRLSRHDRLRNVRGAFVVARPETVAGKAVVLLDDVFTTGTTLSECADALKDAGAAWVGAVTVARVVLGPGAPVAEKEPS